MGYLISETTKEEREAIVAESLGNIEATCDGCMSGVVLNISGEEKKNLTVEDLLMKFEEVSGEVFLFLA